MNTKIHIADSIRNISRKKVIVFGDLMIDRYIECNNIRLCNNSQIPIITEDSVEECLGGAANVANNLYGLGCEVLVCGIIGDDKNGLNLIGKLSYNVDCTGILKTNNTTITKNIISVKGKKKLRYDIEKEIKINKEQRTKIKEHINLIIDSTINVIIISDYNKGTCDEELCKLICSNPKKYKIPVLVDSKAKKWDKYKGSYIITPNIEDVKQALKLKTNDRDLIINQCRKMIDKLEISKMILTCSQDGFVFLDRDITNLVSSYSKVIIDSVGCGDTLIATISLLLESSINLDDILKVLSIATYIVANKKNTASLTIDELLTIIEMDSANIDCKVCEN